MGSRPVRVHEELVFLKLGGSLITDKSQARTPRQGALDRLAREIGAALEAKPDLRLVLGHGSGSYGHVAGKKHGTRQGVHTPEQWRGFAEVWFDAATLNRLVMEALQRAGLPAISLPPVASVIADDGRVASWDLAPLRKTLRAGLLPVVFGDVVYDRARGGTILSTEDLFAHLAIRLKPQRLLLAGIEAGVWADFPACTRLIAEITPENLAEVAPALGGSTATDVTGGMASKVQHSLDLAQQVPGLEVLIFSGETEGAVREALLGVAGGTVVRGT
ncbi:MAG TPA: isopentenyl phosphate kinase [Anaerolineales bacterium]|nr:isopentenyl phosphate kinase [Anaerolineales bacterium]